MLSTRILVANNRSTISKYRFLRHFSSGEKYSSEEGNIFGDERDLIARELIRGGGSREFVMENLKENRNKLTHDPKPFSADADMPPEQPFLSVPTKPKKKVSVIGCGQVGLAVIYSLMNQNLCGMISLVDLDASKLKGEVKDFQQGTAYLQKCRIEGSTDYDVTQDSDLVIITAGAAQKPGESRLNLLERNVPIMRSIIDKVLEYSPKSPICIVSNPVDIMTAIAAKIAGKHYPPGQIFGSGTVLDTGRFLELIGSSLNINNLSVEGFIIGEHGDSSVPVFSSVRVGSLPLVPPGEEVPDMYKKIHEEVWKSAYDIIERKGNTNWAIGGTCAHIADVVLNDLRKVLPVTTCVRGYAGNPYDVYLSVPCIVGEKGVIRVLEMTLNKEETDKFNSSAHNIWEVQKGVWGDL